MPDKKRVEKKKRLKKRSAERRAFCLNTTAVVTIQQCTVDLLMVVMMKVLSVVVSLFLVSMSEDRCMCTLNSN